MRRQERKETSEKFNCRYKSTSCKSTDKIAESTVVYIALVGRLIRREITARRRRAAISVQKCPSLESGSAAPLPEIAERRGGACAVVVVRRKQYGGGGGGGGNASRHARRCVVFVVVPCRQYYTAVVKRRNIPITARREIEKSYRIRC